VIEQLVEPGDGILLVIKGVVPFGTSKFTEVTIKPERPKPAAPSIVELWDSNSFANWQGFGDAQDIYNIANAKVEVIYTSKYKNGVHIDLSDGSYWMRKPDGWHHMFIGTEMRVGGQNSLVPKQPQRLKEAR
jgi:hypothetical protein